MVFQHRSTSSIPVVDYWSDYWSWLNSLNWLTLNVCFLTTGLQRFPRCSFLALRHQAKCSGLRCVPLGLTFSLPVRLRTVIKTKNQTEKQGDTRKGAVCWQMFKHICPTFITIIIYLTGIKKKKERKRTLHPQCDPTSARRPSAPSVMSAMLPLRYLRILKGTLQLLYQHNYMPPTHLIKRQI